MSGDQAEHGPGPAASRASGEEDAAETGGPAGTAGPAGAVVTVTPNPSLDRTYEIAGLARGAVLRAEADRVDPGGKGVNVSRALAAAGSSTVAVLPLGGPEGALLAQLLGRRGIEVAGVPVRESTRVNISLAEPDGSLTKINAPGPQLSADEAEALLEAAGERATGAGASWIVCSGSLPRGLPPGWYAGLVARVHEHGVRIALDTSGPALRAALRERPDVIKPNAGELAEAVGRPLATVGDAVKAAEELRGAGAGAVLASLGATGQLLVDASGTYFGSAPSVPVRSDVGAGDASLAGFLGAGGAGPRALAPAVAHGLAAVQLPGSEMPRPADLRPGQVTVTAEPPLDHPLGRPLDHPVDHRGRNEDHNQDQGPGRGPGRGPDHDVHHPLSRPLPDSADGAV
ncbi:1-phosphofructokinase [Streptomyces sp. HNM0575]|uniref:1-phosphofructokinase n=1 Tax=Streptomyces sp. HNM0575 TaxID=2716338 RepID=UPI00145E162A|nr:1-phosphofructokinase [Streptomyces sp. HNM0575]NLU75720.1 1-phosphofructokinase [Streptomyces sp. HNM0575]